MLYYIISIAISSEWQIPHESIPIEVANDDTTMTNDMRTTTHTYSHTRSEVGNRKPKIDDRRSHEIYIVYILCYRLVKSISNVHSSKIEILVVRNYF